MGRLIDADILIAELKESALHHCNNPREDSLLQRDRVIVRAQPTVEAITKADYETRLKADMVVMFEKLNLEIDEMFVGRIDYTVDKIQDLIQQKINTLKGENETC